MERITISFNDEQFLNALISIEITEEGIITFVKVVQSSKSLLILCFGLPIMLTDIRLDNTFLPTKNKEGKIDISFNDEHPLNPSFPRKMLS